jgi:hypothetical protein
MCLNGYLLGLNVARTSALLDVTSRLVVAAWLSVSQVSLAQYIHMHLLIHIILQIRDWVRGTYSLLLQNLIDSNIVNKTLGRAHNGYLWVATDSYDDIPKRPGER